MIIHSLLDTDLYKFTMAQCILHKFPNTQVEYKFKCRNLGVDLTSLIPHIQDELRSYCSLKFRKDELDYIRSLRYVKPDFVDFLRHFQPCEEFVNIGISTPYADMPELEITIAGPWIETIWFEVPLLAIVNQVYFASLPPTEVVTEGAANLYAKLDRMQAMDEGFRVAEFGTRRRYSREWHAKVIESILASKAKKNFHGTSNVLLAKEFGITPIGTMAHEFLQASQALVRVVDSQKHALQSWAEEYRGDLGIALTDVVGIDAFFHDFDLYFAKLFDGVRHDSGDPNLWMAKVLNRYEDLKVDARTKIAVFSDGLDMDKAIELYNTWKGKMKLLFAIGTNLTNDVGLKPLNIVIKMTRCNGQPVAKISDSKGKKMCRDDNYLNYLASVFKVNLAD